MNTCSTCKHWRSFEGEWVPETEVCEYVNGIDVGVDLGLDLTHPWGGCYAPSGPSSRGTSKRMQVWDASSYRAVLTTRDDFGCVEHSPSVVDEVVSLVVDTETSACDTSAQSVDVTTADTDQEVTR